MKLSVIFGVLHMSMGIVTKGTNCVYFRDWPSLVTEVIAGLIILLSLFGWMDLLIIVKWITPVNAYSTDPAEVAKLHKNPAIITVMINNFLKGGN